MTGPEHYRIAEHTMAAARDLIDQADEWMDADSGWKAQLSSEERLQRRSADLASAQVLATLAHTHATLAVAAATAELDGYGEGGAVTGRTVTCRPAWDEAIL